MRVKFVALAVSLAAGISANCAPSSAAEAGEAPKPMLVQGFEKTEGTPARVWATDAEYEIHSIASVEEPGAPQGSRCMKVDVTLKTGTYFYLGGPMRVRPEGGLALEGQIRLVSGWPKGVRIKLGAMYDDPQSGKRGRLNAQQAAAITTDGNGEGWKAVKAELGWLGDVSEVAHSQAWVVMLNGNFKGQRLTFFVDELQLHGKVVRNLDGKIKAWRDRQAAAPAATNADKDTTAP